MHQHTVTLAVCQDCYNYIFDRIFPVTEEFIDKMEDDIEEQIAIENENLGNSIEIKRYHFTDKKIQIPFSKLPCDLCGDTDDQQRFEVLLHTFFQEREGYEI